MRRSVFVGALALVACSGSDEPERFGVTVEGRIEDATGAPVPGWQVRPQIWTAPDCTGGTFGADARAVTAPDGTFSLDIPHFRAEPACIFLISNDTTTGVPYANAPSATAQVNMRARPYETVQLDITLPP